ncbi:aldo/keto reductase [Chryseobacterium koreense]|uniref:Aldo/keto reductase n=1 Tax=Chryseobacterium koreense CCUG 49689 TaxID=1304281 RepID=A0A0J7J303_9FLAO|nr:aldo/keto reductase [Chryseobacterium koreense]KMQ72597.1 aldo/keto reductase [Chryseobacterium koreense CCUG 49689]MBB5332984.1 putative oxidoreductase [Chryseobacterium koreense]
MKFSPIIVGTMRWGIWGANHSEREVQGLIETSMDLGLSTFDHADIYGDYTTEKLFGDAFSKMKIKREEVQLISKCGIEMPCENRDFKLKSYNYSKEYILNSVDKSLENLKTDYLDLLLLHRPSPLINPEEIGETFGILRENHKVRHFGVSNFSTSQFDLINDAFPLVTNQIEVSVNQTNAFYDGTLDQMMLKKLQPMAWSVMGNYFTEKSIQNIRIKKVLEELCPKYHAEENQILLTFILKHPAKILPIVGTAKAEILRKFSDSLAINLEREDWFRLLEASVGEEVK